MQTVVSSTLSSTFNQAITALHEICDQKQHDNIETVCRCSFKDCGQVIVPVCHRSQGSGRVGLQSNRGVGLEEKKDKRIFIKTLQNICYMLLIQTPPPQ